MHAGKERLESSWILDRNQFNMHKGKGKWPMCQQLWIEMADSGLAVADNVFLSSVLRVKAPVAPDQCECALQGHGFLEVEMKYWKF